MTDADDPPAPTPHPPGRVRGTAPPPRDGPFWWVVGPKMGECRRGERPPPGPGIWCRPGDEFWTRLPDTEGKDG
jgi:hypothetical protein